jgi:sodium/hydrogen exchanger-like protein 6/7
VLVARYASTVPLSKFINYLSTKIQGDHVVEVIPKNHQVMLWWAGLRGAIAFALSVEVKGPASMPIRTTTLVVCVFTIVILGGTTKFMLDYLDVPTGERAKIGEYESSSESDYSEADDDSLVRLSGCSSNNNADDDPLFSRKTLNALRGEREISNWLVKIDKKYLKPIFCIKKTWDTKSPIAKIYEHSGIAPERDLSVKNTGRI